MFYMPQQVKQKGMRQHVGAHIVKGHIPAGDICGFCGRRDNDCKIKLVRGAGKGVEVPESNCVYSHKFNMKSARTPTKSSPCTNIPIRCPLCPTEEYIWKYNFVGHLEVQAMERSKPHVGKI